MNHINRKREKEKDILVIFAKLFSRKINHLTGANKEKSSTKFRLHEYLDGTLRKDNRCSKCELKIVENGALKMGKWLWYKK